MPEIVEQRGCQSLARASFIQPLIRGKLMVQVAQTPHETCHHMRGPERVRKPSVIGARIGEGSETELANPA